MLVVQSDLDVAPWGHTRAEPGHPIRQAEYGPILGLLINKQEGDENWVLVDSTHKNGFSVYLPLCSKAFITSIDVNLAGLERRPPHPLATVVER